MGGVKNYLPLSFVQPTVKGWPTIPKLNKNPFLLYRSPLLDPMTLPFLVAAAAYLLVTKAACFV